MQEVQLNPFFKWEKVGDEIQGYLVAKYEQESKLDTKLQMIYELELTKPTKTFEVGDILRVGGRQSIDIGLRKAEIGMEIRMVFESEVPSKKKTNNAFKLIKVYIDKDSRKKSFDELLSEVGI